MGRWTPLILMAGGLAILLGTLLGINFPMNGDGGTANLPTRRKTSEVLPANINVNSTGAEPSRDTTATVPSEETPDQNSIAQSDKNERLIRSLPATTDGDSTSTTDSTTRAERRRERRRTRRLQNNAPIRALW